MTKEQFSEKMRDLKNRSGEFHEEYKHQEADEILSACLKSLGYDEGVDIFNSLPKWYEY